jgi:methionyl-tRNA synthetase
MTTDERFYVTTAIPYVNAAPHLGHALELVQADVLARHRRLRGQPVRFLTGTDDNALKNVAAARAAGVPTAAFVAANTARYAALREPLSLSFDDFIATSTDPRHAPGVAKVWRRCEAAGDLYRHSYRGLYCLGCEQFYDPAELVEGLCPEHRVAPEVVEERNWFFRLTRYRDRLLRALESGEVRVAPPARRNEVLSFVRAGLADFSVSRPAERADGWGIPVPGDPGQVVYVWWDALTNYVNALGYASDDARYRQWWTGAAERVHVIGKGIVRFHAVYWVALLLSTGQPLPTTIYVHDYLTAGGARLSKSSGNVVDPTALAGRYGTDALRWWLLRDVAAVGDTDFTTDRLVRRANQDLAGGLGNLVHRTLSLVHRYRAGRVPGGATDDLCAALPGRVDRALAGFDFRAATAAVCAAVDAANRLVDAEAPWRLARAERDGDPGSDPAAARRLDRVLATLVRACRVLAVEAGPFIPDGAGRLRAQLGDGERIGPAEPVFPRGAR